MARDTNRRCASPARVAPVIAFLLALAALAGRLRGDAASEVRDCGSWIFQEDRGNAAIDSSGHGNHGRVSNARWIQSDQGSAMQFLPQARAHIQVPNSPSLNLADMLAIDVWVKTYGPTGNWQGIVAKRSDSNPEQKVQYQLSLKPDLELSYCVTVGGPNNWWYPATGVRLKPNQWYHIVTRYDAFLRTVEIYVDGKLAKRFPNVPVARPSENPLWIGWTGWADEFFNGELRQVRVVDLVAERIAELKKQGIEHAVLLSSSYVPHQYRDAKGGLRGTVLAMALNPQDKPEKATLRVRVGQEIITQAAEMPAVARSLIRCTVPEPAADTQAQVELVAGDKTARAQPITIPGSQPVEGFRAIVVSHTHSDFAWADSMAGCLDKNVAAVAKSVELAEKYPDFRFCMEHMLAVREYLRRNPDKLETLRKLMREGRFEAGGFYTGPWELTAGPEALIRELYFGKLWVKKTLGADPVTVWNVDVAGHVAQLPQILQKAGIKGFVISAGSSGPALYNWLGRDGSSVLTWNTPWGYGAGSELGLRDKTLDKTIATMPRYLEDVRRNTAAYNLPKIGFIADGFDVLLPSEQVVENIRAWNKDNRYPPMTYASTADLFAAVEKDKPTLPSSAGEMPSPWDTVQSQGNECFTPDRQLDGRVLAAEKFAAFRSVVDPSSAYPSQQFGEIWQNRLYAFDHNWGGWHGAESNRLKAEMIQKAGRITDDVLKSTLQGIAANIKFAGPAKDAVPIVVFNPLSWDRKDIVICSIPRRPENAGTLNIVDSRGRPVPYQVTGDDAEAAKLVFCAEVPPLGYATYYTTWGNPQPIAKPEITIDTPSRTYESRFYRLKFDPASGGIASIIDKRTGRELVRPNGKYKCNELLVLEDDDEDIGLHLTGKQWMGREHPSTVSEIEGGPVRLVIEVAGKLLNSSTRRQQIILYSDLPRIDFVTQLDWEGKRNVHVYQTVPLNVPEPTVRYATPYGWEQYGREMKYAAPWFNRWADPVAKHNWRGLRGWVELANGNDTVTLASQCNYAAFKDVSANPEQGFLIQPLLLRTIRSCGDGGKLYYEQKGRQEFRFALAAQADSSRLGEELDSPLLCWLPSGAASGAANLPDRLSFLSASPANVHVAAVKKAEDGNGLIVRLVEMNQRTQSVQAELRSFHPIKSAEKTNIIEEPDQPIEPKGGAVNVPMAPAAIETVRIAF